MRFHPDVAGGTLSRFSATMADDMAGRDRTARIYLDHAATTPLRDEVREAMVPLLGECFGNPSSLHLEGRAARTALESARETIRARLRGGEFRLAFTSGGTEADSAAVLGGLLPRLAASGSARADLHVVSTAVEHAAVLGALEHAARWGIRHTLVRVDSGGRVDPADIVDALTPATALVSVMTANNEVGTLQPIREIGELLRARGVPFHTDAIQFLGKGRIDLETLPVDLVTLSAHKVGGPKGVGALLVRASTPFEPIIRGGAQQDGLRGGTEGVAGAVGFARAVDLAVAEQPREWARLEVLRNRLLAAIEERIRGVRINTPVQHPGRSAPHILGAAFAAVSGESLLLRLDHLGVAVSTGSACNVGAGKPSHVLAAMGLDAHAIRGSLRFSLGRTTTAGDIDDTVDRLDEALRGLRSIAPSRS